MQAVEQLDVVSMDSVRDMVDELGEKVLKLEEGVAELTQFHTFKPDEVDEAYAHISTPMGPHTAPRDPIPHITPEQTTEDEAMADVPEEISPEAPKEKTFSKVHVKAGVPSKNVVSPDDNAEAKTSNTRKYTADELQQMVATKKINFA